MFIFNDNLDRSTSGRLQGKNLDNYYYSISELNYSNSFQFLSLNNPLLSSPPLRLPSLLERLRVGELCSGMEGPGERLHFYLFLLPALALGGKHPQVESGADFEVGVF